MADLSSSFLRQITAFSLAVFTHRADYIKPELFLSTTFSPYNSLGKKRERGKKKRNRLFKFSKEKIPPLINWHSYY